MKTYDEMNVYIHALESAPDGIIITAVVEINPKYFRQNVHSHMDYWCKFGN